MQLLQCTTTLHYTTLHYRVTYSQCCMQNQNAAAGCKGWTCVCTYEQFSIGWPCGRTGWSRGTDGRQKSACSASTFNYISQDMLAALTPCRTLFSGSLIADFHRALLRVCRGNAAFLSLSLSLSLSLQWTKINETLLRGALFHFHGSRLENPVEQQNTEITAALYS